ncbi:MAG: hypothetical protein V5A38_01110 [Halolamina sp.]|uniref:hypothetical protein n=1 Tax=Halolamina sp. TaxID=1940283 RepID=UPI002FC28AE6
MSPSRRTVTVSLVVLTLLSVGVVAEAERNYANVITFEESTASVADAEFDDGVVVTVRVHNSMNRPIRVQYVHVDLSHEDGRGSASTPYQGFNSISPGTGTVKGYVPARLISGNLSQGDAVTVTGTVTVRVYNDYRLEIPIEQREVTL